MLNKNSIKSLVLASASVVSGIDYTNADNWYPAFHKTNELPAVSFYSLSIPGINIENAIVSTIDTDLKSHLVNFNGTAVPPASGTSIVFGHSTLPQLYNPKDYKTILANAHMLKVDDNIIVSTNNSQYTYKIFSITIVEPEDTSVLSQDYSGSFLTLITCTPPGTIWKRLVIKAQLEKT